jgi:DNA polymerase-1
MLTVNNTDIDWAEMPLDEMAIGCVADCDFTLRCWKILKKEAKGKGVNLVYSNLLKEVVPVLGSMENTGIFVDQEYRGELDTNLEKTIESLKAELISLSGKDDLNPNSTPQVSEVLFESEGFNLTPSKFSLKTKKPSITEEHLSSLYSSSKDKKARKFIKKLLEFKNRVKMHRTYVKGVQTALEWNEDGRVYSNYNFATTVTGRLSCSRYSAGAQQSKGVSFHTLPRASEDDSNIRGLMRADKGKVFVAIDFSTAELRVLAQCCRDENLMKAFQEGEDLHKFTASIIFEKELDEVTPEERQISKSCNFLIVYGGSYRKLAEQTGKSEGYCKNIFSLFQEKFPKVFKFMNSVNAFVRKNEFSVSLFGRRRNLPNVKSPNKKYQYRALRQGLNFVIQSSTSDIVLHSLLNLKRRLEEEGLSSVDLLATVHDSIELQCEVQDTSKVCELAKEVLEDTSYLKGMYDLDFLVPMKVDVEIGTSFGHLKGVEFNGSKAINTDEILKSYRYLNG